MEDEGTDGRVWTGFIWIRIGTGHRYLWA